MSQLMNKAGWVVAGVLALLVVASISGVVWGGPLNPPGPPSVPTGKTQINSLPYTISVPGSYIVNADLNCTCAGVEGITITVSDVTLDLQGFSVRGAPGSYSGIYVSGLHTDIEIRNGVVVGWGLFGVEMSSGLNSRIEDLRLFRNQFGGIYCDGATVRNNSIDGFAEGNRGIFANDGCIISDNSLTGSGNNGIDVLGSDNAVLNNTLSGNSIDGTSYDTILIEGNNNRIDGNIIDANGALHAITVAGSFNVITRNSGGNASGLDFNITGANNTFGPTIVQATVGSAAANPWANIAW